jgi:serine/threonine protein kinase
MEYVEGQNLAEFIKEQGCVDVPRAIDLFLQISEAVEYASNRGILHRDIKPPNIIVFQNDGVLVAKLVDFGVAKILPGDGIKTQGLTQTGEIFGSPQYMSPEQCLGNEVDTRSDIYSLGCVMYEALCGKAPITGANSVKVILNQLHEVPISLKLASRDQEISSDLNYLVMRCLAKAPEERYQTVGELRNDILSIYQNKPLRKKGNGKTLRASPSRTILLGATIASLIAIFGIFISRLMSTPSKPAISTDYPDRFPLPEYPGSKFEGSIRSGRDQVIMLRTDDSGETVDAFYKRELQERGWSHRGSSCMGSGTDRVSELEVKKGNLSGRVIVESGRSEGTSTKIQLSVLRRGADPGDEYSDVDAGWESVNYPKEFIDAKLKGLGSEPDKAFAELRRFRSKP